MKNRTEEEQLIEDAKLVEWKQKKQKEIADHRTRMSKVLARKKDEKIKAQEAQKLELLSLEEKQLEIGRKAKADRIKAKAVRAAEKLKNPNPKADATKKGAK